MSRLLLVLAILAPLASTLVAGLVILLRSRWASERFVAGTVQAGLTASALASVGIALSHFGVLDALGAGATLGPALRGSIDYGNWIEVQEYAVPAVLLVDHIAVTFSLLAAVLTALIARFSRTYLHREAGFARFYILIGLFAVGAQLVAFAGALDLFFAGWELIGIASAFFIGFFHERDEPARSSVRAFATYRLCDAGLLVAMVMTHELLGSTRFDVLVNAGSLPVLESTAIAALFLLSAMGKSAQLPFSGWLPRAMEGPTPSSALFYGAISIHAGLFLMLRVSPALDVAPVVAALGVIVGVATAVYAAGVARVHTDAKGALAHATLAQIGLILAEISLGLTTLALVHLVCHAFLRAYQYLRAPNMLHDVHEHGHVGHAPGLLDRVAPRVAGRVYASSVHRWRLDERIDAAVAPVLALAGALDRADIRTRALLSLDRAGGAGSAGGPGPRSVPVGEPSAAGPTHRSAASPEPEDARQEPVVAGGRSA